MDKQLIIFHLIDDYKTYHRMPMIKAFAENAKKNFDILCVCPPISIGSVFKARLSKANGINKVVKVAENLFCYTPIIPEGLFFWDILGKKEKFYLRLARKILKSGIVSKYRGKIVNWIYRPEQSLILKELPDYPLVYECYDDYLHTLSDGLPISGYRGIEDEIMNKSLITFVTSSELYNQKSKIAPNVVYAPNGVDYDLFSSECEQINKFTKPIIGFIGNIAERIDYEILSCSIENLPEFSFVFVGPVNSNQAKKLKKHKNVFFTGFIKRERLPEYLNAFDAAIMPFKVNKAMDSVNPLKLWEYLASGKVVVSTPIKELIKYKGLIMFAKTKEEFAEKIKQAVLEDNSERIELGRKLAKDNSWDILTGKMVKALSGRLK